MDESVQGDLGPECNMRERSFSSVKKGIKRYFQTIVVVRKCELYQYNFYKSIVEHLLPCPSKSSYTLLKISLFYCRV
jgi:hypothetical protein